MKYFVTGATGFVGGALARKLREQNHDVIALVRNPDKASGLSAAGVRLSPGDIADIETLRAPMSGVDGVFHVAGWYKIGTRDKQEGFRVNVQGTRNVLQVMQDLKIPKGVYTSTLAINSDTHGVEVDESYRFEGRYLSVYDQTKAEAHKVAEEFISRGLPVVIVQPGLIYGPGDTGPLHDALIQFLQRKLPVAPARTAYSWAHVDDIAEAHIAAMDKGIPGESYLIWGPSHTFVEAARVIEQISGVPAPRFVAPPALMRVAAALMKPFEALFPLPYNYTSEYLRVSAGATYLGKNDKARRELGFAPRSLQDGMRETIEYEMRKLKGTDRPGKN